MVERPHITEDVARMVADAIRDEGGVLLGTPEWCMDHGFGTEDYEAFLRAGVRQGAEFDFRDANQSLCGTVGTMGVPRKIGVDGDKITLTVAIESSRAGDVARLMTLMRQTCDISLTPANMPLPLDIDPQPAGSVPLPGTGE